MGIEVALGFFYSQADERRLFVALDDNPAVRRVDGVGVNLMLTLDLRRLTEARLRDLLALLWRYRIPLAPLYRLADKPRFAWLHDRQGYWYASLFDPTKRTRSRKWVTLNRKQ